MDKKIKSIIQSLPGNDICVDCGAPNPTWASVSFGTLSCLNCSGIHRGMGVHISFVRSIELDSWSEEQIQRMLQDGNGGNDAFVTFMTTHYEKNNEKVSGSSSSDIVVKTADISSSSTFRDSVRMKYQSRVAQWYKAILTARIEGKPEPSIQDIKVVTVHKQTSSSASSSIQMRKVNENSTPSNVTLFIQAFKYWKYTLFDLPCQERKRLLLASIIPTRVGKNLLLRPCMNIFLSKELIQVITTSQYYILVGQLIEGATLASLGYMLYLSFRSITWFKQNRLSAFNTAKNTLRDRVNAGRAKRNPLYDIYFPPGGATIRTKYSRAILFYPEFLVDHTAYAPILSILSDQNTLVICVNLESSLRIPTVNHEGGSAANLNKIFMELERYLGIQVIEWIFMGHGHGAGVVTEHAKARLVPNLKKVVLWAPTSCCVWKNGEQSDKVYIHVIYGTNDPISKKQCSKRSMLQRMTSSSVSVMSAYIQGGNHSAFAHYGPQHFPIKDGDRSIAIDDQQKQCVSLTMNFIMHI